MKKLFWLLFFTLLYDIHLFAQVSYIPSPSDGSVLSVKANQVTITWEDNSDTETSFYIYRSESNSINKSSTLVGKTDANVTSFTDKSVYPQTTYYYSIQAINYEGESLFMTPFIKVTTLNSKKIDSTLPSPDNISVLNVKSKQATIEWNNLENIQIDGYRIYRATEPIKLFYKNSLIGETKKSTTYIDSLLSSGTKYYYSVASFNQLSESPISTKIVSVQTLSNKNIPPQKPNNVILTNIKTNELTISWTDNANNEDGFWVYRFDSFLSKDSILIGTVSANDTKIVDNSLVADKYYYYKIFAFNTYGFTGSDLHVGKTLKVNSKEFIKVPNSPNNIWFSQITTSSITINWGDASDNEDGFYLYRATNAQFSDVKLIAQLGINSQTYTDNSLNSNTTYYYLIVVYNIAGNNSNYSFTTTNNIVSPPIAPPIIPPNTDNNCEDFTNHGTSAIHLYANTRENLLVGTFYAYNQPQYNCYGEWKDAMYLGNEMGSGRKLWGYRESFKNSTVVQIKSKKEGCTIYNDVRNTYPYSYLGDEKIALSSLSNNINHINLNLTFFLSNDIDKVAGGYNIYKFALKNHLYGLIYRVNGGEWKFDAEYKTDNSLFSNIAVNYTNIPFMTPPKDFIIDFSTDSGNSVDRYIVRRNTVGGHFGVTTTLTRVQNNEVKVCMYQGDPYTKTYLIDPNGNKYYSDDMFGTSFNLGGLPDGAYFYKLAFMDTNIIFDNTILVQVK